MNFGFVKTFGLLPRSRPEDEPETFGYPSGIKVEWAVAGD
jgi:hypothetical protein